MLSQFVIHRGMIISIIEFLFIIIFYYVSISIYNSYLLMGYSTCYTTLPVFSIVLDEDVDHQSVMNYPPLYKSLQKGRSLNFKTFLIWTWKSIYQGSVIMISAITLFNESYVNIISITFTALIYIEFLNVFTIVHKIKLLMIISVILSLLCYMASFFILTSLFELSYITLPFMLKVLVVTMICWLPLHLFKKFYEKIDPSEERKIKTG